MFTSSTSIFSYYISLFHPIIPFPFTKIPQPPTNLPTNPTNHNYQHRLCLHTKNHQYQADKNISYHGWYPNGGQCKWKLSQMFMIRIAVSVTEVEVSKG